MAEPFCPYKGLQPFDEADRDYFFGREEDRCTIAANLVSAALTVVYGSSGVGKSSILQAGVIPFLRGLPDITVVMFRDWQDERAPETVRAGVRRLTAQAPADAPLDDLLIAAAASNGGTIAVIFDQFEDYLFYHRDTPESTRFDEEFARAVNRTDVPASFLVALREDSLALLDRFEGRIPNVLGNFLRLNHLDSVAAGEAIRLPLAEYNRRQPGQPVRIEEELVTAVLEQVETGQVASGHGGRGALDARDSAPRRASIEAPFLQLVMERLWAEDAASGVLRAATLDRLGGAGHIVEVHLTAVMDSLSSPGRELCARCFDRLVTPSGKKIAYTEEDLARYAGDLRSEVRPVLRRLTDSRLLRAVVPPPEERGTVRYEIFHDVLAPAVLDWCAGYKLGSLSAAPAPAPVVEGLIGNSPPMRKVYDHIAAVAARDVTVLITGESGTGKELVARAIHRQSRRADRPFVAINCAALTENLLEVEMFGHERGAFTGAYKLKKGRLETADGGTMFLDEVGELAPGLQARFLRVLQEREFERVGGTRPIPVDVRFIAATNRDLASMVREGKFRQDLFHRLNVTTIAMPPLRERSEDIVRLAEHFIARFSERAKRRVIGLSEEARTLLQQYEWPGNVRELENAMERAVILGIKEIVLREDLPEWILEWPTSDTALGGYRESLARAKKDLLLTSLRQAGGNYALAAQRLGISPSYLHRLVRNLRIEEHTP